MIVMTYEKTADVEPATVECLSGESDEGHRLVNVVINGTGDRAVCSLMLEQQEALDLAEDILAACGRKVKP